MTTINEISNHIMGYFDGTLDAFERVVLSYINGLLQKEYQHHPGGKLKELNNNHHYMANASGDTIQVHFNDTSLFIIITMTGQY